MKNNISKIDYSIFFIIVICILASFYINYISLIGLFIAIIYILKNSFLKGFYILFFLLPFAQVFKLSSSSTSLFTLLEWTLIVKQIGVKRKLNKNYIWYVGGFTTYVLVSSFISGNINILQTLKVFMNLSLLYFFIDEYKTSSVSTIITILSTGMIISSILGLFKTSIPGLANMYHDFNTQYIYGARVTRFSGTFSDPNYYSIAVIVTLGIIICYSLSYGLKIKYLLFSIILVIFGFFTYSKSYILSLAILAFIIVVILLINKKIGMTFAVTIIACIIVLTGTLNNISILQSTLSRFSDVSDINSLTTGRADIWEIYIEYINANLRVFFIGDGIGAPYLYGATHNLYLEIWYYVGIIGIILYIYTLRGILNHRILNKSKIINYYLLIIVLIMYIFLAGFTAFEFPFYMMICWMALNTKLNKKNNNNNNSIIVEKKIEI